MRPLVVVVLSANALVRNGIRQVIGQSESSVKAIETFAQVREMLLFLSEHAAQVVIMEDAPTKDGISGSLLRSLTKQYQELAVIVITARPSASLVRLLLQCGVRGVLYRDDDLEGTLIHTIQTVAEGGVALSVSISRLVTAARTLPRRLRQRDLDVLELLADGFQVKEIAMYLGVTPKTVYRIVHTLRRTLEAKSNMHLLEIARQKNLFLKDG